MRQLEVYFYHGVGSYAHNVELHAVRDLLLVNVIAKYCRWHCDFYIYSSFMYEINLQ